MSKKQDNHKIINEWVERNLTQETAAGSLSKAFEVDRIIDQLTDCILIFVISDFVNISRFKDNILDKRSSLQHC